MAFYSDHQFEGVKGLPCEAVLYSRKGEPRQCGADWCSVLHPPDQFRHWCAALEAGGDCCHEEV